jgi:uncharacterized Fe-S cluster-containing radical SAM superfamily protein
MDRENKQDEGMTIAKIDLITNKLRSKSIHGNDQFLISRLTSSNQEKDLSEGPNCQGFGRIHHFKLKKGNDWINDPLPHQVAAWKLGLPFHQNERVQVFQNAACNCRCWYCFVDYDLLSASRANSDFKTADELLEMFLQENDRPYIIDLSGGQPDIIPEWPVRMMEALIRRNLADQVYLWLDDNLTTYSAWRYLSENDFEIMKNFKNFGRVGCFKGFSPVSFHENTMVSPEIFKRQIDIMSRWVSLGLDMYGYITLTTSDLNDAKQNLKNFMDDVQNKIHSNFLLRIVPLKIDLFTPTSSRMNKKRQDSIFNQYDVLSLWKDEIDNRYSKEEQKRPIYSIEIR